MDCLLWNLEIAFTSTIDTKPEKLLISDKVEENIVSKVTNVLSALIDARWTAFSWYKMHIFFQKATFYCKR